MKLYRTNYIDDLLNDDKKDTTERLMSHWSGTQADAALCRKNMKTDGMRQVVTLDVDFPTHKDGLLNWLNNNVNSKEL
jgi:hypothetical protein